jgi:chorismate dehydratase
MEKIDLQEDIPSICAQKLKFGQVDLALVPVALLPELDHYSILSDFCIGANGKVDTVKLYSRVPIKEIKSLSLDYQSKSSNALSRVLFHYYWKQKVEFKSAMPGFENLAGDSDAMVVIGDRCFELNGKFPYEYDLAETWKNFTGLPFVFAAWVGTTEPDKNFIMEFNDVLQYGIKHIDKAVAEGFFTSNLSYDKALHYLTERIDYNLDASKLQALEKFLNLFKQLPPLKTE